MPHNGTPMEIHHLLRSCPQLNHIFHSVMSVESSTMASHLYMMGSLISTHHPNAPTHNTIPAVTISQKDHLSLSFITNTDFTRSSPSLILNSPREASNFLYLPHFHITYSSILLAPVTQSPSPSHSVDQASLDLLPLPLTMLSSLQLSVQTSVIWISSYSGVTMSLPTPTTSIVSLPLSTFHHSFNLITPPVSILSLFLPLAAPFTKMSLHILLLHKCKWFFANI